MISSLQDVYIVFLIYSLLSVTLSVSHSSLHAEQAKTDCGN